MGAHLRDQPSLSRPFQRLLAASWASNLGDGVRNAALPLVAITITSSATTVTAVAAATTLPFVLFGVLAGTLADRNARVPIIVRAHLFRAVVVTALAALLLMDAMTVEVLVFGAFLLGCGEAVADSAAPALVPVLVDDDALEQANGDLETAELVANDLVGPPVGSVLFSAATAAPFLLDAVSFVGAAGVVRSIDDDADHDPRPPQAWRHDLTEGIRTAWSNPVLRVTGLLILALQIGNIAAIAPIVVYLTGRLQLDPANYGLFLAIGSFGGIIGSRVASRLIRRFTPFTTLLGSIVTAAAAFLLMVVPNVVAVGLGFAVTFGAVVIGRIVVVTARQRAVPNRLLGRAQGAIRTLVWGAATIGALVGGFLADNVGVRAPFVFAASLYLCAAFVGWRPLRSAFETGAEPDPNPPEPPGTDAAGDEGRDHIDEIDLTGTDDRSDSNGLSPDLDTRLRVTIRPPGQGPGGRRSTSRAEPGAVLRPR